MDLDKKLSPDIQAVLTAAAMLDITEFELFRLAWARWYGRRPQPAELEPFFVKYMFHGQVPTWVRHFARDIQLDWDANRLDREALGVLKPVRSTKTQNRGVRYAAMLLVVLVVLVVLAQLAAQLIGVAERCVFPPCY